MSMEINPEIEKKIQLLDEKFQKINQKTETH